MTCRRRAPRSDRRRHRSRPRPDTPPSPPAPPLPTSRPPEPPSPPGAPAAAVPQRHRRSPRQPVPHRRRRPHRQVRPPPPDPATDATAAGRPRRRLRPRRPNPRFHRRRRGRSARPGRRRRRHATASGAAVAVRRRRPRPPPITADAEATDGTTGRPRRTAAGTANAPTSRWRPRRHRRHRRCRRTRPPSAVATGAAVDARAAATAVAEQSGRAAVASAKTVAAVAKKQTRPPAGAGVALVAGLGGPAVAVADQHAGIGVSRGAIADEELDTKFWMRVGAGNSRRLLRCGTGGTPAGVGTRIASRPQPSARNDPRHASTPMTLSDRLMRSPGRRQLPHRSRRPPPTYPASRPHSSSPHLPVISARFSTLSVRKRAESRRTKTEATQEFLRKLRLGGSRRLWRLGGFGDRPVDPAHQVAQLLAGDLDRVLGVLLAQPLELLVAALDVGDQALDEGAVLDVGQDVAASASWCRRR